jgi:hypothetical protein
MKHLNVQDSNLNLPICYTRCEQKVTVWTAEKQLHILQIYWCLSPPWTECCQLKVTEITPKVTFGGKVSVSFECPNTTAVIVVCGTFYTQEHEKTAVTNSVTFGLFKSH